MCTNQRHIRCIWAHPARSAHQTPMVFMTIGAESQTWLEMIEAYAITSQATLGVNMIILCFYPTNPLPHPHQPAPNPCFQMSQFIAFFVLWLFFFTGQFSLDLQAKTNNQDGSYSAGSHFGTCCWGPAVQKQGRFFFAIKSCWQTVCWPLAAATTNAWNVE